MNGDHKKPYFKIGQKVHLNKIVGTNFDDYPFFFTEDMLSYDVVTIDTIESGIVRKEFYKMGIYHDGYIYTIKEDLNMNWYSSSMFLEAQEI